MGSTICARQWSNGPICTGGRKIKQMGDWTEPLPGYHHLSHVFLQSVASNILTDYKHYKQGHLLICSVLWEAIWRDSRSYHKINNKKVQSNVFKQHIHIQEMQDLRGTSYWTHLTYCLESGPWVYFQL